MKRIHLFEFEDQDWLPRSFRDYMTDFLGHLANALNIYDPILPIIERGLSFSEGSKIIDLGSGSGGAWTKLSASVQRKKPNTQIILTDYFPNEKRVNWMKGGVLSPKYMKESIDARSVPDDLKGLRTLFLVFHHFKPQDARMILQDSVNANQPIAIFEGQERSLVSIIGMVFSPVTLLITTPWIRPFEWKRMILTYAIPILPLLVFWDGVVSCLRTYSAEELQELVLSVKGTENFDWEMNKIKSGPGKILYLLGTPKVKTNAL